MSYQLNHDQVQFFRQMGYLRLSCKISEQDVDQLKSTIVQNFEKKVEPLRADRSGRIMRLENLVDRESVFLEAFTSPMVLDPLESLLGPNIEMPLNRHNCATINLKGSIDRSFHRDALQWSRSTITVIIFLEDSTPENGCTELIPGSHYFRFVGTTKRGAGGTWMREHSVYEGLADQALPIPMPAGGILMFDGLTFHTVGENKTDSSRMSIIASFHSVDELCGIPDDPARLLVHGERIYTGYKALSNKVKREQVYGQ